MPLKTTHPLALSRLFNEEIYLIDRAETTSVVISDNRKPEVPSFEYLGDNNKYLLILVDQPGEIHINKENRDDLEKILKAMNMELRDAAIFNLADRIGTNFQELKDFFACAKVVLFGIDPARLSLPAIPGNQIVEYQGVKLLATYSFAEMADSREKKAAFWNEMKKLQV